MLRLHIFCILTVQSLTHICGSLSRPVSNNIFPNPEFFISSNYDYFYFIPFQASLIRLSVLFIFLLQDIYMNFKIFVAIFFLTLILSQAEHIQYKIRRGQIPMRGVNLGGWLVAQHWMTYDSSIWQGVPQNIANQGQFKTMQSLGHTYGDSRFDHHRATWITQKDIIQISNAGLNSVRVPVGYWIVGFDNHDPSGKNQWKMFAPGGLKYLDLLIKDWANKHNVAVFISIHAAKGSQNGNDHSAPSDPGKTYWSSYQQNIDNTIDVAGFLASRYKDDPAFLGIGLLNQPAGNTGNQTLKQYYRDGYNRVRKDGNSILLSHAPLLWQQNHYHWSDFTPPPSYQGFLHEWHKYLVWGFEGWSADRLINQGIPSIKNDIAAWTGNWMFVGEWSVASSQRIGDQAKFREFVRLYFDALKQAHGGYTYWTWKISGDEDGSRKQWSFRNLYRSGYIQKSYYQV